MWCDLLTNPKQGDTFSLDRSHLMNVTIDYDDDVERRRNHPSLVPEEDLYNLAVAIRQTAHHHRSVLVKSRIANTGPESAGAHRPR